MPTATAPAKLQVKIGGMHCSFCTDSIKKAYRRVEGVHDVNVSLAHEEALFQYDPDRVSESELKDTLHSLGYTVRDPNKVRTFEAEESELRTERNRLFLSAGLTLASLAMMAAMWLGMRQPWFKWVFMLLALTTVFGTGRYILQMSVASVRRGIWNQHVLMELGAFGGLIGGFLGFLNQSFPSGDFFAVAVFVTTYHILSGYVSMLVRTRSSQAVRKLMDLQPDTARVIRDGREAEVPLAEVQRGDLVRIRPGDRVPVDGEVMEGTSSVNESLVTGEPIPVQKTAGSSVIGGAINQSGALVVRVTRVGEESFLQQVIRHVEEARALKPGILQAVDLVLKYFVPGVVTFAAAAFLFWSAGSWLLTGTPDWTRAIFATLAVLVMGYPCALGMASPLAMIRGGGLAASKGILMRTGEAFEVFKDVKTVVLDKTGTITRGEPGVTALLPAAGWTDDELLALAASAESVSEHPLAQAIVGHALDRDHDLESVTDFQAEPGLGITATLGGEPVAIGSPRFIADRGAAPADLAGLQPQIEALEAQGSTVVVVARGGQVAGAIAIADTLKTDAAEAIARLKAAGLEPVMITGDNERTARAVAAQVGIDRVMAQVLPGDKAAAVRQIQQTGHRVAMVGDGINDAPGLTQADVGIAIGAGTDIAIESSEVILVGDRLGGVVDAYHIARSSYRKTVQNLTLAFAFNGIGVPLATTGIVHPAWAMAAMALSVTAVLLNSFGGRLLPTAKGNSPPGATGVPAAG